MSDAEIREFMRSGEFEKAARLAVRSLGAVEHSPTTREAWLERMVDALRPVFGAAGHALPEKVRVSVGFPSKGGLRAKKRVIGQCWAGGCTPDGVSHVFVSPVLEGEDAAHVLVHELVHATVGCDKGHGPIFTRAARALGLAGKPTATTAGEALKATLGEIAARIGGYPHAPLVASEVEKQPKQTTRLVKLECACGRKLRASRAVIELGPIGCGVCGEDFVADAPAEEPKGEEQLLAAAANKGGVS